jgi:hypothetical protein
VTGSPGTAQKTAHEFTPNIDQWISKTTWSLKTKFWGDDELPTTAGIANPCQEHCDLGFIQKSTNRRPNPAFEGSRSSIKRHKALTHDPLKEIQRETPQINELSDERKSSKIRRKGKTLGAKDLAKD